MSILVKEAQGGKTLEIQVRGKLSREDYGHFVPEFERLLREHGRLRVLFEMVDFHGWEGKALWDDIVFDLRHGSHIDRLAMVGDRKWERGMSVFCRPFTSARLRYFDRRDLPEARSWVEGP